MRVERDDHSLWAAHFHLRMYNGIVLWGQTTVESTSHDKNLFKYKIIEITIHITIIKLCNNVMKFMNRLPSIS